MIRLFVTGGSIDVDHVAPDGDTILVSQQDMLPDTGRNGFIQSWKMDPRYLQVMQKAFA